MKKRILFFTCILLFSLNSYAANIKIENYIFDPIINIEGEIVAGDCDKLKNLARIYIDKHKNNNGFGTSYPIIHIKSNGGDLLEATKIGEFIRKSTIPVRAYEYCYSSCATILLSAVDKRAGNGTIIGIHRPFFERQYFSNLNLDDAERKYTKLMDLTREYYKKVGVPTKYIDLMFGINSDDMYILTDKDKDILLKTPPAYAEWMRSKCGYMSDKETNDAIKVSTGVNINASDGYKKYLLNKMSNINTCEQKVKIESYLNILE